jgi:hypothetical protein
VRASRWLGLLTKRKKRPAAMGYSLRVNRRQRPIGENVTDPIVSISLLSPPYNRFCTIKMSPQLCSLCFLNDGVSSTQLNYFLTISVPSFPRMVDLHSIRPSSYTPHLTPPPPPSPFPLSVSPYLHPRSFSLIPSQLSAPPIFPREWKAPPCHQKPPQTRTRAP